MSPKRNDQLHIDEQNTFLKSERNPDLYWLSYRQLTPEATLLFEKTVELLAALRYTMNWSSTMDSCTKLNKLFVGYSDQQKNYIYGILWSYEHCVIQRR